MTDLAVHLARSANLSASDRVYDMGFGCGDQISVFQQYGIQSYTGQTCSRRQYQFAANNWAGKPNVKLILSCTSEPKIPRNTTKILALDSLYHINRSDFLRNAHACCAESCVVAFTDLLRTPTTSRMQNSLLKVIEIASGATFAADLSFLSNSGWRVLVVEDLTDDVFLPLGNYLSTQSFKWRLFGRVVSWWSRSGTVRFLLVTAEKSTVDVTLNFGETN